MIKKVKIIALAEQANFVYVLYANGFRYRALVSVEAVISIAAAAVDQGLDWRELDSMTGVGVLA